MDTILDLLTEELTDDVIDQIFAECESLGEDVPLDELNMGILHLWNKSTSIKAHKDNAKRNIFICLLEKRS